MVPELRGATVRLRPLRADDVPAIVATCRDPESVRWTTVPTPYHEADAVAWVGEQVPAAEAAGTGWHWAVTATGGPDDYLGTVSVRMLEPASGVGDVGFVTAPWARGRGLMSAALPLACRYGFERLGLARLEWRAYLGNDASRRVAERAGFGYEGVQRSRLVQRGERRDCWLAALLPTDLAAHDSDEREGR